MKRKLNCVLLVDDNESDNFLHKRVVEKAGITHQIETVLNGKEALDFITVKGKSGQRTGSYSYPDLVFLDINMPVMDGWEFLAEYQNSEDIQKEKIVLIILTTSLNPADKSKAEKMLNSGCFQFKPLTLQMLHDIMRIHFPEYL